MAAFDWDTVNDFFTADWVEVATYGGTQYNVIRYKQDTSRAVIVAGESDEVDFMLMAKASDFTPAVDALITQLDGEYSRLATAYPTQAETSTNNISNMATQLKRELVNMPKAGIHPEDTQLGVKNSVLSLVTNLHDYGTDDSLGGTGWILENVASTDFYGESLIAALREGRNIRRLNDASIGNALSVQANTRTSQKASLVDSTYTVDEAKNNL